MCFTALVRKGFKGGGKTKRARMGKDTFSKEEALTVLFIWWDDMARMREWASALGPDTTAVFRGNDRGNLTTEQYFTFGEEVHMNLDR